MKNMEHRHPCLHYGPQTSGLLLKNFCSVAIVVLILHAVATAANVPQVMAVTVMTADLAAQTVFAKTTDGTKQTFRFSSKTPVTSLAQAGINRNLHGGAGYQFLIHYQGVQGEKVATAFHYIGREEWKKLTGTVVSANDALRTIDVKSEAGQEEKFVAGQYCAIQTSTGVKTFRNWAKEKTGEQPATIYYTVIKNGNVAHLIELSAPAK